MPFFLCHAHNGDHTPVRGGRINWGSLYTPFCIILDLYRIAGMAIVTIVWTYNLSIKLSKWEHFRLERVILAGGVYRIWRNTKLL